MRAPTGTLVRPAAISNALNAGPGVAKLLAWLSTSISAHLGRTIIGIARLSDAMHVESSMASRKSHQIARSVHGVVAGALVWMAAFSVLAIVLSKLWPDFAIDAHQWMRARVFTFTAPMACCNLVLWAVAAIGAGWVTARISRRHEAVWVLARPVGIDLAILHLVLYWSRLQSWYNLGVVVPAAPAVLFDAKLASYRIPEHQLS